VLENGQFSVSKGRLPGSHFDYWTAEKSPGLKTVLLRRNSLEFSKAEFHLGMFPALGQAPEETPEWAGNPGFSRVRFCLRTPALPDLRRKSPKVSGHFRKYSRFGETIGGDGFDQDCRPTLALGFGLHDPMFSPGATRGLGLDGLGHAGPAFILAM
jgi:hypothetical protein